MEGLELLSDNELRTRLQQYGFANLPVTDTTRKILVKKLKLAMEGQNTKNRRETVAVTKFSSDEEPEKVEKPKRENRRATVAVTEKVNPVEKVKATNGTGNGNSRAETPTSKSRRSSRATPLKDRPSSALLVQDDSDDDVVEIPVNTRRSRTNTPTLGKSDTVRTSYKTKVVEVVAEQSSEDLEAEEVYIPAPRNPSPVLTQSTTRRKTFTTSSSAYTSKQPEKQPTPSKFGRASLTTSYNPRGNYNFDSQEEDRHDDKLELDETNTPYLSNFAKRLSTLKADPLDSGMSKYKSLAGSTPTSYKPYNPSSYSYTQQPAPVARKGGFMRALEELFDSLDRQYNFRKVLLIAFFVLLVVAVFVFFIL